MKFNTSPPPKNSTPILVKTDYPTALITVALWNEPSGCYAVASHGVDMYQGVYNDTYFETEFLTPDEILGWLEA